MGDWCQVNEKYYRYTVTEPTEEDLRLQSLCIPTQTEIRNQLGSKLADVFFENLSSEGRIILGLQPPLTVPEEVWINPDLRLRNKVRCKPVPEPQVLHQKAFTHHSILELGEQYIKSLRMKMSREIQESLTNQAADREDQCNTMVIAALEKAKAEADEHCKQVVGTLMEHFDRCFSEMVENSKLRMRKECQRRVQEETAELASYMLVQLQEEIEQRDSELCSEFNVTLNGELNALASKYMKIIDSERKVAQEVLQEVVQKYETMLVNLRSEMEICSLVDVCRAISEEKAKQEREARGAEEEMRKQAISFAKWMNALKDRNKMLQEMATERSKRIRQYEKKMRTLIEEFQKFINFALKATPAHAEFLLSMQKTMMKKYHEDALENPEDYEDFKNCLLGKLPREQAPPTDTPLEEVCSNATGGKREEPEEQRDDSEMMCKMTKDSKYAFNYYKFKYNLLKNLVKGIKFESKSVQLLPEKGPCTPKEADQVEEREEEGEEIQGESAEELEQYKKALTLVGENEKEHLQPVQTFLTRRMEAIVELCRNDPEMVKMVLGCPKT